MNWASKSGIILSTCIRASSSSMLIFLDGSISDARDLLKKMCLMRIVVHRCKKDLLKKTKGFAKKRLRVL